jgi:hypothetical protein
MAKAGGVGPKGQLPALVLPGVATIAECPPFWHTDAKLELLQLGALFAAASGAKAIAAAIAAPTAASGAMDLAIIGGSLSSSGSRNPHRR